MIQWAAPAFVLTLSIALYEGIVAYAYHQHKGCDPMASGQIDDMNQVRSWSSWKRNGISNNLTRQKTTTAVTSSDFVIRLDKFRAQHFELTSCYKYRKYLELDKNNHACYVK